MLTTFPIHSSKLSTAHVPIGHGLLFKRVVRSFLLTQVWHVQTCEITCSCYSWLLPKSTKVNRTRGGERFMQLIRFSIYLPSSVNAQKLQYEQTLFYKWNNTECPDNEVVPTHHMHYCFSFTASTLIGGRKNSLSNFKNAYSMQPESNWILGSLWNVA